MVPWRQWVLVLPKRLRYDAAADRVFYRPIKRRPGDPNVFAWTPLAFIKRLAPIRRAAAP